MKRPYEIKLVIPHTELELANTYLKNGYRQTWVTFEGVVLVKESKSKAKTKAKAKKGETK